MQEFTDKVVLITGAGRGLGKQIALAFSSLGARVAANDINPLGVDETVKTILDAGGKANSYVFDIAKRMPIEGLVAQLLNDFGRIDFLINHASVAPDAYLLEMDEWEFHRTLDVNLAGPFFTMQQVGRVMQQQGSGVIINIIPGASDESFQKGHSAYSASQSGLIGLTQAAGRELSAYNIRVNALCRAAGSSPGWDAAIFDQWRSTVPDVYQGKKPILLGKVLFLCSEAASSLNGQVIFYNPEE
jgi:3-oxoacyl-[acyl-carrier protein] reductase